MAGKPIFLRPTLNLETDPPSGLYFIEVYMSLPERVFSQASEDHPAEVEDTVTEVQTPARVILFNDDWHTFDEVIGQLIKALGCGTEKAEAIAFEAHSTGKAFVYEGPMQECLKINGVLEEIGLITQIEI